MDDTSRCELLEEKRRTLLKQQSVGQKRVSDRQKDLAELETDLRASVVTYLVTKRMDVVPIMDFARARAARSWARRAVIACRAEVNHVNVKVRRIGVLIEHLGMQLAGLRAPEAPSPLALKPESKVLKFEREP